MIVIGDVILSTRVEEACHGRVGQIDVRGWGPVLDYLYIPHDTFNSIHLLSTRGRLLFAYGLD